MRRTAFFCLLAALGCDSSPEPSTHSGPVTPEAQLRATSPGHATVAAAPKALTELDDSASSKPPKAGPGPQVYAKSRNVWVRSAPSSEAAWLGMLWFGGSVPVRPGPAVPGQGCGGKWVPVEPRGYVCVDGERATQNADDPAYLTVAQWSPKVDVPSPHRYAWVSSDVHRFESLAHAEPFIRAWAGRKAGLFGHPVPELPRLPGGLSERRDHMAARSGLSIAGDGDYLNTGFWLLGDLSWVARADVEVLPEVTFQGVELKTNGKLPLAFTQRVDTPVYQRTGTDGFTTAAQRYPRHTPLELDPAAVRSGKAEYFRVAGTELWVRRGEVVVVEQREPYPEELRTLQAVSPRGEPPRNTWVEVSVLGGFLIAYEGDRPVYATLISAGRGGLPVPGKDLVSTASTPVGRFHVTGKFRTATMESSSGPIVHSDVPWTQNFSGPHAIHGAYWHNDWGTLKSAGCVNVSPRDGKWLFDFSEPSVPQGWHGVRHHPRYGAATLVVLHD